MTPEWKKRNILNAHILCTEFDDRSLRDIFRRNNIQDARTVFDFDFIGNITMFRPQENMTMMDIWYIQNLCIMQRLHQVDRLQKQLEEKLGAISGR